MIRKSKLGVIALVALIGAASPAFAAHRAHVISPGMNAFARIPQAGTRYDPGATGGGNPGYNYYLEHDY